MQLIFCSIRFLSIRRCLVCHDMLLFHQQHLAISLNNQASISSSGEFTLVKRCHYCSYRCRNLLQAEVLLGYKLWFSLVPCGTKNIFGKLTTIFEFLGCFCTYSNPSSLEYIRDSLEKTLLSNLEQEDRLPFQGLPLVIVFAAEPNLPNEELLSLREEGRNLADRYVNVNK